MSQTNTKPRLKPDELEDLRDILAEDPEAFWWLNMDDKDVVAPEPQPSMRRSRWTLCYLIGERATTRLVNRLVDATDNLTPYQGYKRVAAVMFKASISANPQRVLRRAIRAAEQIAKS